MGTISCQSAPLIIANQITGSLRLYATMARTPSQLGISDTCAVSRIMRVGAAQILNCMTQFHRCLPSEGSIRHCA